MPRVGDVVYCPSALAQLFLGDAVVLGGSLAGVAAALELAKAGARVAVVEPRTYLGHEITSSLRPWLPGIAELPEPLGSFLTKLDTSEPRREEEQDLPFAMDALKIHLEDVLLEAGAKLLYASLPIAVVADERAIEGVVIGNKSGRQVLSAPWLIDASGTTVTRCLIGDAGLGGGQQELIIARILEFDGLRAALTGRLPLPAELGLVDDQVLVRPGYRGPRHALVECRYRVKGSPRDGFEASRRELRLREEAMRVAIHLMGKVPAFSGAYLAGSSLESSVVASGSEVGGSSKGSATSSLAGQDEGLASATPSSLSDALAGDLSGLWFLCREALEHQPGAWADPLHACRFGAELGKVLAKELGSAAGRRRGSRSAGALLPLTSSGGEAKRADHGTAGLAVREPQGLQTGRAYDLSQVAAMAVPIERKVDVLVVGGGTSGATAATVAAREGLATVLVDMNPGLGGTGTYGGVNDYWFGRRVGFSGRLNLAVDAFHACLRHEFPKSDVPRWNIDAKAHVLAQAAQEAGVEMLLDAFVIGTIVEPGHDREKASAEDAATLGEAIRPEMEGAVGAEAVSVGDRVVVRGVVVATRFGPLALLAETVIDATGDGDVAAFAGAEHVYGAQRGHVTMWYSLAQFALPGHTRNNFTSTVDIGNVEDYTRAILAGRRRKRTDAPIHDHGIYLAPRETRHILGEVVLTLSDQLLQRAWPDVVNIAFSNNDVKGHTTSDWVRAGLISPNLEVEVPYRALVPRTLDGILVVGKAISATHDALPAIRMQADLENLGGVAALAAAAAAASGGRVREVDVGRLQRRLVEEGVLPAQITERELMPWRPTEDDLRESIRSLSPDRPLYAYSDMPIGEVFRGRIPIVDICCAGPLSVPALESALGAAQGARRLLLAVALALVESPAGVTDLIAAIEESLAGGELPRRAKGIRHAVAPPDQGAMPEVVYLIHALGMTRDRRALPVWGRVVDLLEDVTDRDFRDGNKDVFDYVDAVCVGAERLGDPEALPILERLHGYPALRDKVSREPYQADYFWERQAYLELTIGRAMARCGGRAGMAVLADYLADNRAMLAQHAYSELLAISGCDLGKDADRWRDWWRQEGERLRPMPWSGPTDPVATWDEEIMLAAGESSPAGH